MATYCCWAGEGRKEVTLAMMRCCDVGCRRGVLKGVASFTLLKTTTKDYYKSYII